MQYIISDNKLFIQHILTIGNKKIRIVYVRKYFNERGGIMTNKRIVCKRLKGLMTEHEITINDLAKRIGISENSLAQKINGHRDWWHWEVLLVFKQFNASNAREVFPELYDLVQKSA